VCEYHKAMALAVTPAEMDDVVKAKEEMRLRWVAYYLALGDLSAARRMGWDGAAPAVPPCIRIACFGMPCRPRPIMPSVAPAIRSAVKLQLPNEQGRGQQEGRPSTIEEEAAVVKVQSVLRGKAARDSMQEDARLEWLRYFCDSGEFDKALNLCINASEEALVMDLRSRWSAAAMNAAAISVQSALRGHFDRRELQESARLEWLTYYKAAGEFEKAKTLCISPAEEAEVAQKMAATMSFETAIQGHEWDIARSLAASDEERRDLADSVSRVAYMTECAAKGQIEQALELAITQAERADILGLK